MERKTGVEPAAFSLARRCSTTELLPLANSDYDYASSQQILHGDELVTVGAIDRRQSDILTRSLPKFAPFISPMKAAGAFSKPSTMSSRYFNDPSLTHSASLARATS